MFRSPFAARGIAARIASLPATALTAIAPAAASLLARRSMLATASALTLVGALSLTPASASASTSDTYVCTNGSQSSTAPSGAVSARVTLNGAAGKSSASGAAGGTGEGLAVTTPVTPGQQFDVYVGCQNDYGGGGPGGWDETPNYFQPIAGGSGGGASYLVPAGGAFSQAYAVAPGGGGGGDAGLNSTGTTNSGAAGGSATPPTLSNGSSANTISDADSDSAGGGQGGSGAAFGSQGGQGGLTSNYDSGVSGGNGSSGSGGNGGFGRAGFPFFPGGNFTGGAGGGGGGGWQGGGGGGAGAVMANFATSEEDSAGGGGGGAGSEYVASNVSLVSDSGSIAGDGSVSITYYVTGSVSADPSPASFGQTVVGGAPSTQTITVTDNGSGDDQLVNFGLSSITGAAAADYSTVPGQDNCSGAMLSNGQTCTVQVAFAPSLDGQRTAGLRLSSNATNGTLTTQLSGTGAYAQDISTSPNPENFGSIATGSAQTTTFVVYNTGDETLHVGALSLSGTDAGQFALVTDQDFCSTRSVPGNSFCLVQVSYSPTATGPVSAQLLVPSDAISGADDIALAGTGTTPAPLPTNGANGTNGTNGTQGPSGANGTTGTNGNDGQPGATGPRDRGSLRPLTLSDVSLSAHTLASCAAKCAAPKVTLAFRVTRLSSVHLTLERLTAHGWLLVGVRSFAEFDGRHLIELGQSFAGHLSAAGRYRLLVLATNGQARSRTFMDALQLTAARRH
jgi:archaellum component FlaG (FlaF/FlaG flagellin family)